MTLKDDLTQMEKDLALIESASKPILTLVEEFAPDVGAIVAGGGTIATVQLIKDIVNHISDIRAAVNGVIATVQQIKNESGAAVVPNPAPVTAPPVPIVGLSALPIVGLSALSTILGDIGDAHPSAGVL